MQRCDLRDRGRRYLGVFSLIEGTDLHGETLLLNSGVDWSWNDPCWGNPLHGTNIAWRDKFKKFLHKAFKRFGPQRTKEILNPKPTRRNGLLYEAAARNQCAIVRLFFSHGANPEIERGYYGTPLMAAACYGRLSAVQELVRAGANVVYFCSTPTGKEIRSTYLYAELFPKIQRWLLVGLIHGDEEPGGG